MSVCMLVQINFFVRSVPQVSGICWVPSVIQDRSQSFGQPQGELEHLMHSPLFPSPGRSWELWFFSHLLYIKLSEELS